MKEGDKVICTECGMDIIIDFSDLDEGEALCTSCGNCEPIEKDEEKDEE
jgi:hypothetical protein